MKKVVLVISLLLLFLLCACEAPEPLPSSIADCIEDGIEFNPEIPLGKKYKLGQGKYVVGEDIPEGRYLIEWVKGNKYGGNLTAEGDARYLSGTTSIDPKEPYTTILLEGEEFEISLATLQFTKITLLPNKNFMKKDGSYVLHAGVYFEGIDIPCGKYNVKAVSGNQFGITLSTTNDSYISLEPKEEYNNLKLDNEGGGIGISLGTLQFIPRS